MRAASRQRSPGMGNPALARLCQFDVLGVEEERRLFRHLKAARDEVGRSRVPRLRKPVVRGNTSAERAIELRNRIAICNLRLVVSVAKHFATPQQSLEDLVSEASLLLLGCVERFDAERGTRFSTYATRALVHHFARLRRRERRRAARSLSFDCADSMRADAHRREDIDRLVRVEELQRLRVKLAELPTRERALLAGRFGLGNENAPATFRELGDSHGLSKEWARVMTAGALEQLRASFDREFANGEPAS
jgi:RNA polymerase sigma factor (sigma-70 family)